MKSSKIKFIASVSDERIGDMDMIVGKLKDMGCSIDNILTFSGVITGSIMAGVAIEDLKIDGIKHIEVDKKVKAIAMKKDVKLNSIKPSKSN